VITSPLDMSYSQRWSFLNQNNHKMLAFVVMPNHIHAILYFPGPGYNLNKIISNAKRFLAYEMIKQT
jgi:REP element-mobilizing transposase RayT